MTESEQIAAFVAREEVPLKAAIYRVYGPGAAPIHNSWVDWFKCEHHSISVQRKSARRVVAQYYVVPGTPPRFVLKVNKALAEALKDLKKPWQQQPT